ncbi:MAG TPA: metallophosphoesterase, partial [Capillimicrobium sp.]|nr:metallophosphoesterase [Capillimicrobium sp.]
MTTLVISDLHLGGRSGVDVLRDEARRRSLLDALEGVERLVLLGDALELRHGPQREALAAARPVLEDLGGRVGEVVIVPGNHDHALVDGWLRRRAREAPDVLQLEQRMTPAEASWAAEQMAAWLGPRTSVAYPGLWLRDDVYATHGHYLDLHSTVPTFERLGAGLTTRLTGEPPPAAFVH